MCVETSNEVYKGVAVPYEMIKSRKISSLESPTLAYRPMLLAVLIVLPETKRTKISKVHALFCKKYLFLVPPFLGVLREEAD